MNSVPASPEMEPFLVHLLHLCLLDTAFRLPSHLRAVLLAPFHLQGALKSNEPLYKHLASALLTCTETNAVWSRVFELVATLKEEPFFSQLKGGLKTIEGRCAMGLYNSILPGDLLLFNNALTQVVQMVNHYNSFDEMLKAEVLDQILPGVTSFAEGVAVYRQFYSEEQERLGGVLAIHVKNVSEQRQPLTVVRSILEELAINGVEALHSFVAPLLV